MRPFLKSRFRIDRHFRNGFRLILPQLVHDRARFLEAAVDEHRPEQRLGGVCEDRRLVSAAAVRLALGKNEMGAKPDIAGNLGAGFAANEAIVAPGEFAFARVGVLPVQGLRDREPEDAIADELEAFVVEASNLPAADARMRERALQELRFLNLYPNFVSSSLNLRGLNMAQMPLGGHRTRLKNLSQRMSNGQVQGAHQRKASGSSTLAEKKMISARPMKFS